MGLQIILNVSGENFWFETFVVYLFSRADWHSSEPGGARLSDWEFQLQAFKISVSHVQVAKCSTFQVLCICRWPYFVKIGIEKIDSTDLTLSANDLKDNLLVRISHLTVLYSRKKLLEITENEITVEFYIRSYSLLSAISEASGCFRYWWVSWPETYL